MGAKLLTLVCAGVLLLSLAAGCSRQQAKQPSAKEQVQQALKQNGMDKINVDENREKGVITLKGDVESDAQKTQAAELAQQAAPGRVIANELAVRREGAERAARKIDTNVDSAIEHDFKAEIAAHRWEHQHIRYKAKNGVLTLKGDVATPQQRTQIEQTAAKVPGVQQVVNELRVKSRENRRLAANP